MKTGTLNISISHEEINKLAKEGKGLVINSSGMGEILVEVRDTAGNLLDEDTSKPNKVGNESVFEWESLDSYLGQEKFVFESSIDVAKNIIELVKKDNILVALLNPPHDSWADKDKNCLQLFSEGQMGVRPYGMGDKKYKETLIKLQQVGFIPLNDGEEKFFSTIVNLNRVDKLKFTEREWKQLKSILNTPIGRFKGLKNPLIPVMNRFGKNYNRDIMIACFSHGVLIQ